ncbi:MAG: hypothetical protein C6W58_11755 [Bacillaceae bacterium]|nr:MAG: hypothetical protein C6W58_11755 [Bacillaceae bacterium]
MILASFSYTRLFPEFCFYFYYAGWNSIFTSFFFKIGSLLIYFFISLKLFKSTLPIRKKTASSLRKAYDLSLNFRIIFWMKKYRPFMADMLRPSFLYPFPIWFSLF